MRLLQGGGRVAEEYCPRKVAFPVIGIIDWV
jgi:hypothetical protein